MAHLKTIMTALAKKNWHKQKTFWSTQKHLWWSMRKRHVSRRWRQNSVTNLPELNLTYLFRRQGLETCLFPWIITDQPKHKLDPKECWPTLARDPRNLADSCLFILQCLRKSRVNFFSYFSRWSGSNSMKDSQNTKNCMKRKNVRWQNFDLLTSFSILFHTYTGCSSTYMLWWIFLIKSNLY